jgi:hypothetical protein
VGSLMECDGYRGLEEIATKHVWTGVILARLIGEERPLCKA